MLPIVATSYSLVDRVPIPECRVMWPIAYTMDTQRPITEVQDWIGLNIYIARVKTEL
jgi:hypothetical protein